MTARVLTKEVTVPAPPGEVFRLWTTKEGVESFFAPSARIELAIGGAYEIFFDPDAPEGSQGADGVKVLSYLPDAMLSFTWDAPPAIPTLRHTWTQWVVLRFEKAPDAATCVRMAHLGFRDGDDWDACYAYFDRAWDVVLGRLKARVETGPIDWAAV
jgi:uncharacterized protein YndB with AHSA1/START domain